MDPQYCSQETENNCPALLAESQLACLIVVLFFHEMSLEVLWCIVGSRYSRPERTLHHKLLTISQY